MKALLRRARAAEKLDNLDLALEDYTAICIIETFNNQDSLTVVDRILKEIGEFLLFSAHTPCDILIASKSDTFIY